MVVSLPRWLSNNRLGFPYFGLPTRIIKKLKCLCSNMHSAPTSTQVRLLRDAIGPGDQRLSPKPAYSLRLAVTLPNKKPHAKAIFLWYELL